MSTSVPDPSRQTIIERRDGVWSIRERPQRLRDLIAGVVILCLVLGLLYVLSPCLVRAIGFGLLEKDPGALHSGWNIALVLVVGGMLLPSAVIVRGLGRDRLVVSQGELRIRRGVIGNQRRVPLATIASVRVTAEKWVESDPDSPDNTQTRRRFRCVVTTIDGEEIIACESTARDVPEQFAEFVLAARGDGSYLANSDERSV